MPKPLRAHIAECWKKMPATIRYSPASEPELLNFETTYGPIPEAFRWFLVTCGGGVVGSEWIDGLTQLAKTHRKYFAEQTLSNGWKSRNVFPIGWDGAGNPIVLNLESGSVAVEDHNFGGSHELATTFEEFMLKGLKSGEA